MIFLDLAGILCGVQSHFLLLIQTKAQIYYTNNFLDFNLKASAH